MSALARQVHYSTGYLSKIDTGKKRVTPELARREPTGTEVCPYPGLAAFGPDQARWFLVGIRPSAIWSASLMIDSLGVGCWRWWFPLGRVAERTGVEQADVAGDPDRFVAFLTEAVAVYTGKRGEHPPQPGIPCRQAAPRYARRAVRAGPRWICAITMNTLIPATWE